MKRHAAPIPVRRAAVAILAIGFFFATGFYYQGCSASGGGGGGSTVPAPAPTPQPQQPSYPTTVDFPDNPELEPIPISLFTGAYNPHTGEGCASGTGGGNLHGCVPPQPSKPENVVDVDGTIDNAVDTVVDGVNSAVDWWEDDPLNDHAEEVFDNLNTIVETAGDVSETMNDIACAAPTQAVLGDAGPPGIGILIYSGCTAIG